MYCALCCKNIHYQIISWVIGAVVGQGTLGAHKGTILFPEHWQLGLYAPGGKLKDPSQGKVNCLQENALQRKNHFCFRDHSQWNWPVEKSPFPKHTELLTNLCLTLKCQGNSTEYQTFENSIKAKQKTPKKWGNIGNRNKLQNLTLQGP